LSAPRTRFSRGAIAAVIALYCWGPAATASAEEPVPDSGDGIQLQLSPRVCTLSVRDKRCQTEVHASWHAPREESLCLIVLQRPEVKRCWENYSEGTYSLEMVFADDLTFQLRDPELRQVLSSEILHVIREAIRFRHQRRDPWNVFE
jgi:hypothetical protein